MIYHTETGTADGDPVLFLHAGSYSGTMWHDCTRRLTGLRCILPDLPGHGYSREIDLLCLEQAADAVATLITEAYDARPVSIVGLSFGGYVGLMLMARHPQLVQRAMLSGIQLGSIPNAPIMNLFAGLISPLVRLHSFRRKMAAPLGVADPLIYDRTDGKANLTPRTLRKVVVLASVFDVHEVLPTIHVPTLMIAGANEHSTIVNSLAKYQRLMPDCTARTVPDMGHAWCNQDPDLFAQTVQAWEARAPLPPRLASVEA